MASKEKVLLDTSIQIGKFKYREIQDFIEKREESARIYASFYSLFEFKVGLIQSYIDYWNLVNNYNDINRAMVKWSERWGARDAKNFVILHALLMEKCAPIPNNKTKYLRKVEFIIFHLLTNFTTGIEKYLQGDFRYDEIVKYGIVTRKDFPGFMELCEDKQEMADQIPFWTKHTEELNKLLGNSDLKKKYSSIYEALERIKKDISYANRTKTNKVVGDAVIAVDAADKVILATDNSFTVLGKALDKEVQIIPNQY